MADRNVRIVKSNGRKPFVLYIPKVASTEFDKNSLVEIASGSFGAADDNDTKVLGVLLNEIATTDADYASTTLEPIEIIQPGDEVEITVNGTALTVGQCYGISNAYTVDQADVTNDVFYCTKSISTTRARGFFNPQSAVFTV